MSETTTQQAPAAASSAEVDKRVKELEAKHLAQVKENERILAEHQKLLVSSAAKNVESAKKAGEPTVVELASQVENLTKLLQNALAQTVAGGGFKLQGRMKVASGELSLTKHHTVPKSRVTPLEVLVLTAIHHTQVGEAPFKVDEGSIKEITPNEETGGKEWSIDDEIGRLGNRYGAAKVNFILGQFKECPNDFVKAAELGIRAVLPGGLTSQTKASDIMAMSLK